MSMDGLPGKFSKTTCPWNAVAPNPSWKHQSHYGLALPFHQLSGEKNNGNHESHVPWTSNLKISGCPRDRLRAVAQKDTKRKGSPATWSKNSYSRAAFWGFSPSNASSTWFRDTLPDTTNSFWRNSLKWITTHVSFQAFLESYRFDMIESAIWRSLSLTPQGAG